MKVRIFHHHLDTGGVTSVIRTQVRALKHAGIEDIRVLCGREGGEDPGCPVDLIPGGDYLSSGFDLSQVQNAVDVLAGELTHRLPEGAVLHVHNPTLGKNPVVTAALNRLPTKTFAVLRHVHDFAEDGREENMRLLRTVLEDAMKSNMVKEMYPVRKAQAWASLTEHDRKKLVSLGIPEERVLVLPNSIDACPAELTGDERQKLFEKLSLPADRPMILYPVRGIRRKNIGEFLLIAYLLRDDASFVLTRAPKNPVEREAYDEWAGLAAELGIPAVTGAGERVEFESLTAACTGMITTSVQEGFGLAFLEPWARGKWVAGRDIPQVTEDFKRQGIRFSRLYSGFQLPDGGDFAFLSPKEQRSVVKRAARDEQYAEDLRQRNRLKSLFSPVEESEVNYNRAQVEKNYSLVAYAENLKNVYRKLVSEL